MKTAKKKMNVCGRGHKFQKNSDNPVCPVCWPGYHRKPNSTKPGRPIPPRNAKNLATCIILMRGVMPSGKNKVPMARLRETLEKSGFINARTYIQSGNALVDTSLALNEVEERVRTLIKTHIGPDLAIVARTPSQIEKLLKGNPFTEQETPRVFYTLFAAPPAKKAVADVLSLDLSPNKVAFTSDGAYLHIPGSAARSKLGNNFLEKVLGVRATTRNGNTLRALVELATR